MTMDPKDQDSQNLERITLGLQASTLLVHVFCCGLPLLVSFAALGGLTGITLLPFGFETWFHQNEIIIFVLAVLMVAVSAGLQLLGHRHSNSTHHAHHDCDEQGHAHHHAPPSAATPAHSAGGTSMAVCDHEEACERRSKTGRWFLLASLALLLLNAFMTFGFDHGH